MTADSLNIVLECKDLRNKKKGNWDEFESKGKNKVAESGLARFRKIQEKVTQEQKK